VRGFDFFPVTVSYKTVSRVVRTLALVTKQCNLPQAEPANHVKKGQASYFWSGVRPEGPKPEAQNADGGGEVLGDGKARLLPTS